MPWSYCLTSGETFLCKALRFRITAKLVHMYHGRLPSRCLPATCCHPLWYPIPWTSPLLSDGSGERLLVRGHRPSDSLVPFHEFSDGVNTEKWTLFSTRSVCEFFLSMSLRLESHLMQENEKNGQRDHRFSKRGEWGQWFSSFYPQSQLCHSVDGENACILGTNKCRGLDRSKHSEGRRNDETLRKCNASFTGNGSCAFTHWSLLN